MVAIMSFHHGIDGIRDDPFNLLDQPDLRDRNILDAPVRSVMQVVIEAKSEILTSLACIPFGFALPSSSRQ